MSSMLKARALWLAAAAAAIGCLSFPVAVEAQNTTLSNCTLEAQYGSARDVCQKGRDIFAFVAPQLGVALSSGNPILGEGGTLGGWGHRALSIRLAAAEGYLPRTAVPLSLNRGTGSNVDDFGADRTFIPIPTADLAVGLFPGIPAGLTNIGGIDALVGVTWIPNVESGAFSLKAASASAALSYGVRVGLLQESSFVPGVSVSVLRRKTPGQNMGYKQNDDTLQVNNILVSTNAWRAVISKRVAVLGLAAGVGRDDIDASASAAAVINETVLGQPQRGVVKISGLKTQTRRKTAFANVSFGVSAMRIVGEYGWSSAGDLDVRLNNFGTRKPNEGYRYGSLGLTLRF